MNRDAALRSISTRLRARRGRSRGVTLAELLVTMALVSLLFGMVILSFSTKDSARLKHSAIIVASAIRVAYSQATVVGKPVRLVFDFDQRTISMEESSTALFAIKRNDPAGGASPATEAERKAVGEADAILQGPRPSRAMFTPSRAAGFSVDKAGKGKELEPDIHILVVETEHQDEATGAVPKKQARGDGSAPAATREYLYFFPGGQGERAAIQLSIKGSEAPDDCMTVLVSPLTGRAEVRKGRWAMPRPRDDTDASERTDPGP